MTQYVVVGASSPLVEIALSKIVGATDTVLVLASRGDEILPFDRGLRRLQEEIEAFGRELDVACAERRARSLAALGERRAEGRATVRRARSPFPPPATSGLWAQSIRAYRDRRAS